MQIFIMYDKYIFSRSIIVNVLPPRPIWNFICYLIFLNVFKASVRKQEFTFSINEHFNKFFKASVKTSLRRHFDEMIIRRCHIFWISYYINHL